MSNQLTSEVKKANVQYGNFYIRIFDSSHNHFIIIDNSDVYHLGALLKDVGKK